MKITKTIKVPTGEIYVAQGEKGLLEFLTVGDYGKNKGVECASCANYAARVWMERIFGADFFKEI